MGDAPLLPTIADLVVSKKVPTASVASWLHDPGSMTERLKRTCRDLTIKIHFAGLLATEVLGEESAGLPHESEFWLRELQMECDGVPWLYCRALAPQSVLCDPELDLARLGSIPLGERLFSRFEKPERDSIEIFALEPPLVLQRLSNTPATSPWWMRRSRLLSANYAIIITEVFLPATPIYGP